MTLSANKCYIGVVLPNQASQLLKKSNYATYNEADAATDDYTGGWPLFDGAFTPEMTLAGGSILYVYGSRFSFPSVYYVSPMSRAILTAYDRPDSAHISRPALLTAEDEDVSFSTPTTTVISAESFTGRDYQHRQLWEFSNTDYYWQVSYSPTPGMPANKNLRECAFCYLQELPYNQESSNYKRTRTSPAVQEVKTLDGVVRKVKTGPAATEISATFQWSDNGQTAANVDILLQISKENATPLIFYIPSGIYYNGPFLDLVIATNEPAVVTPTTGVYQLNIEGTCQP